MLEGAAAFFAIGFEKTSCSHERSELAGLNLFTDFFFFSHYQPLAKCFFFSSVLTRIGALIDKITFADNDKSLNIFRWSFIFIMWYVHPQ